MVQGIFFAKLEHNLDDTARKTKYTTSAPLLAKTVTTFAHQYLTPSNKHDKKKQMTTCIDVHVNQITHALHYKFTNRHTHRQTHIYWAISLLGSMIISNSLETELLSAQIFIASVR